MKITLSDDERWMIIFALEEELSGKRDWREREAESLFPEKEYLARLDQEIEDIEAMLKRLRMGG